MKKSLKVIIVIIISIISIIILDTIQSLVFNNSPLIKIREYKENYYVDQGIFVKHFKCQSEEKTIIGNKYSCPTKLEKDDLVIKNIIDKTVSEKDYVCAEALEEFYKDNNYIYYWECLKNDQIVVIYENNYEELVSEALKSNHITIEDLNNYNINYYKYER